MTTSFKDFIYEAARKKWSVDVAGAAHQTVEMLDKYVPDWRDLVTESGYRLLYRGFNSRPVDGDDALIIDTHDSLRTSKDTNNIYQILMDESPSLDRFDSRSTSIICTTSLRTAKRYTSGHGRSNAYVIFPLHRATVVVSTQADFIDTSMKPWSTDIDSFTRSMGYMCSRLISGWSSSSPVDDAAQLTSILKMAKNAACLVIMLQMDLGQMPIYTGTRLTISRFNDILESPGSTTDEEAEILQSELEDNKIMLGTIDTLYGKLNAVHSSEWVRVLAENIMTEQQLNLELGVVGRDLGHDVEVWFTGKALAIPVNRFAEVLADFDESALSREVTVQFDLS